MARALDAPKAAPTLNLDVVAGRPRPGEYNYAINSACGFGGHNVAITVGQY